MMNQHERFVAGFDDFRRRCREQIQRSEGIGRNHSARPPWRMSLLSGVAFRFGVMPDDTYAITIAHVTEPHIQMPARRNAPALIGRVVITPSVRDVIF